MSPSTKPCNSASLTRGPCSRMTLSFDHAQIGGGRTGRTRWSFGFGNFAQRGARACQTHDENGSRNFQDSRGLRITELFKRDKQQSLPLVEREGQKRSREFVARRSRNRQIPGGARPARGEIFLLHMRLAAHPSGRQPFAVPFREQRVEV